MKTADKLRLDAYDCMDCAGLERFAKCPISGRLFKFPPVIGKQENAELLFIGINPRLDDTNANLYDWLVSSEKAFTQLAHNRDQEGHLYAATGAKETHYHCHMIVVESVFNAGTKFADKAAVTELYYCANEKGAAMLNEGRSPCAQKYLMRVLETVKPKVVIAVGSSVRKHLRKHFQTAFAVPIVQMVHPRQLAGRTLVQKRGAMLSTIEAIRIILRKPD